MNNLLERLSAPFPPATVSWRVGATTQDKSKGMALAYIDARDVQDRLNEVCGHEWQVRHPWSAADGKVACEIGIKVDGEWIWRGDGAGNSDVEAEKGAFSDSFKRAAVRWGIGRYLYDIDSPWVELEQKGRSYVIAPREMARLRSVLAGKINYGSGAQAHNAPSAAAGLSGAPAIPKAKHPKWQYAAARFREIEGAIKGATTTKMVSDIWGVNQADLDRIEEAGLPYNELEKLRDRMLSKLDPARPDFPIAGSAPGLMGEP